MMIPIGEKPTGELCSAELRLPSLFYLVVRIRDILCVMSQWRRPIVDGARHSKFIWQKEEVSWIAGCLEVLILGTACVPAHIA